MPEETLKKWLEKRRYDCFYNFPIGDKIPDLIAIKEQEIVVFEFKKNANEIPTAIGQCFFFLKDCNRAYIALPQKERDFISDSAIETLKTHGIGLVIFGERSIDFIVKAKRFEKDVSLVIDKIKSKSAPKAKKSKESDIKERVIKILEEHPEGLSNNDISKFVGLGRQSLAKYVYQLLGEGIISQREIGTARLCYLKVRKNARK